MRRATCLLNRQIMWNTTNYNYKWFCKLLKWSWKNWLYFFRLFQMSHTPDYAINYHTMGLEVPSYLGSRIVFTIEPKALQQMVFIATLPHLLLVHPRELFKPSFSVLKQYTPKCYLYNKTICWWCFVIP